MRLHGFKIVHAVPGLEIWEQAAVELPLQRVLAARLRPLGGPGARGALSEGRDPRPEDLVGPLAYHCADGEERHVARGLVAGQSLSALVDFLLADYLPASDGELDCAIRRMRREGVAPDLMRPCIERLLPRSSRPDLPRRIMRRRRRAPAPSVALSPVCLIEDADDDEQEVFAGPIELPGGRYMFCRRDEDFLIGCDYQEEISGVRVPRRLWVVVIEGRGDRGIVCWDGRQLSFPEDLDGTLARRLESAERIDGPAARVLLGAAELRPKFLVVVPPRAALERAAESPPRRALAQAPAFLLDSTVPLALSSDDELPVVRAPGQVRYLLARTARGLSYLPGPRPVCTQLPAPLPEVLIGAWPRSWA